MTRITLILLLLGHLTYGQTIVRGVTTISTDTIFSDTVNTSPNSAFNNRINVSPIDKSKAKVDIRLYKHFSLSNTNTLCRVFLVDTIWNSSEFVEWNSPPKIKKYSLVAKPHYDSFFVRLLSANIMTLPSQADIKRKMKKDVQVLEDGTTTEKKIIVTDGISYTVEIKIGEKFRVYQFDNPEEYAKFYDNVSELQDYVRIVQIFKALKRSNNR